MVNAGWGHLAGGWASWYLVRKYNDLAANDVVGWGDRDGEVYCLKGRV